MASFLFVAIFICGTFILSVHSDWYYLDHGEGAPIQCGETAQLCCASNDGKNCQWGWHGSSWTPYQIMNITINAPNPACVDCPGWPPNDGSDPCQQIQCYDTMRTQPLEWINISSADILSTSLLNTKISTYNDIDDQLIIDATLQNDGCTPPSHVALFFGDLYAKKWQRVRYTIEFVSGASSCWSILGDTAYGGFNTSSNLGLYDFSVADGDVIISNSLSYGSWNGEKSECGNDADNFLHSQHGTGNKGYIRVEQRRNESAQMSGIGSGFSCTTFGSVVRYKDIQVAYFANELTVIDDYSCSDGSNETYSNVTNIADCMELCLTDDDEDECELFEYSNDTHTCEIFDSLDECGIETTTMTGTTLGYKQLNTFCNDFSLDWRDSENATCKMYEKNEWCDDDLALFNYTDDTHGFAASDVCCACGGGIKQFDNVTFSIDKDWSHIDDVLCEWDINSQSSNYRNWDILTLYHLCDKLDLKCDWLIDSEYAFDDYTYSLLLCGESEKENVIFELSSPIQPLKNTSITKIDLVYPMSISMDITIHSFPNEVWHNLFHIGDEDVYVNGQTLRERYPGVWIRNAQLGLHTCLAQSSIKDQAACTFYGGSYNYCPDTQVHYCCGVCSEEALCSSNAGLRYCGCPTTPTYAYNICGNINPTGGTLQLNTKYTLRIEFASTVYRIYLNDEMQFEKADIPKQREVTSKTLWLSDPWYPAADVTLENIKIVQLDYLDRDSVDSPCADGYYYQVGDIPGWTSVEGAGGGQAITNCQQCADLCSDRSSCQSYECSVTELKCNLNIAADPTKDLYKDYMFCTKDPNAAAINDDQPLEFIMNAVVDERNKTHDLYLNPLWFDLDLAYFNQSSFNFSIQHMNKSECAQRLPSYERLVPSQWVRGTAGATCDATCVSVDPSLECDADMQSNINSSQAIVNAFAESGYECKNAFNYSHRDYAGTPFSTGRDSDDCYFLTQNATSVCNANAVGHHYPLCFCKNKNEDNATTAFNYSSFISFSGIHPCQILDAPLIDTSASITPAPTPYVGPEANTGSGDGWIAPVAILGVMFFIGLLYWHKTAEAQRIQEQQEKAKAAAAAQVQLAQQTQVRQENIAKDNGEAKLLTTAGGPKNEEQLPQFEDAMTAFDMQPTAPSEGNIHVPGASGDEVDDWMREKCGIELYAEYSALFKDNGFDTLGAIKIMTDEDLKAIGVDKIGHRRVFNMKIQEL